MIVEMRVDQLDDKFQIKSGLLSIPGGVHLGRDVPGDWACKAQLAPACGGPPPCRRLFFVAIYCQQQRSSERCQRMSEDSSDVLWDPILWTLSSLEQSLYMCGPENGYWFSSVACPFDIPCV